MRKYKKSKDGFVRITIPEDIAERIDEYIAKSGEKYRKRAEVVRHAIIKFFEEQK